MRIMVLVFFAALLVHPTAGQAQQDATSAGSMCPYLGAGVGFWSMSNGDSESGLAFKVKAGFFNFFSDHYALFAEANFNYMKHEDFAMNSFGVALGFAGFLF